MHESRKHHNEEVDNNRLCDFCHRDGNGDLCGKVYVDKKYKIAAHKKCMVNVNKLDFFKSFDFKKCSILPCVTEETRYFRIAYIAIPAGLQSPYFSMMTIYYQYAIIL